VTAACTASHGTQILTGSVPVVASGNTAASSHGSASAQSSGATESSELVHAGSSSPPDVSPRTTPVDTTSPPSSPGTAVADLTAKAAPAIGGPPVTGTMTIRVGEAVPAVTIPGMVKQCLAANAAVTLNGVGATVAYHPSPSVLWCPDDSGLVGAFAAIVVDPAAAAARGCTPSIG